MLLHYVANVCSRMEVEGQALTGVRRKTPALPLQQVAWGSLQARLLLLQSPSCAPPFVLAHFMLLLWLSISSLAHEVWLWSQALERTWTAVPGLWAVPVFIKGGQEGCRAPDTPVVPAYECVPTSECKTERSCPGVSRNTIQSLYACLARHIVVSWGEKSSMTLK